MSASMKEFDSTRWVLDSNQLDGFCSAGFGASAPYGFLIFRNQFLTSDIRMRGIKENSILSFNTAAQFPIDFVEFDVQLLSGTVLSVHWPVKSLPGYSGDLPFNLETGYISVDGIEFFYYFVESEGNPEADPVLLYLNGGPGCSGLNGLFYQIGPLKFNISDYTGGLPTLMYEPEPETWTKKASIIFLDAPVGAGFSYANDSGAWTTADAQAASQYNDFLRSWIDEHPDFDTNPVYIGSDSYAGINLPILAQDIINSNEAGGEPTIYLKGMVLSCLHTNTDIEANARLTFAHRMALISYSMYESAKNSCNGDYVDTTTAACTESLSAITQCIAEISLTSPLDPDCTFLSPERKGRKSG